MMIEVYTEVLPDENAATGHITTDTSTCSEKGITDSSDAPSLQRFRQSEVMSR